MSEKWKHQLYGSGTQIVTTMQADSPHLYIYGPGGEKSEQNRYHVCQDIERFMNGGDRPAWLADMRRVSETAMEDLDGTRIDAVGPMIDTDPPNLRWDHDPSIAAQDARARLIDFLQGIRPSA